MRYRGGPKPQEEGWYNWFPTGSDMSWRMFMYDSSIYELSKDIGTLTPANWHFIHRIWPNPWPVPSPTP